MNWNSEYRCALMGEELVIRALPGLFSPGRLDAGTAAMLRHVEFQPGQRVLDLGCGAGVVGILAARKCGAEGVVLSDVDAAAVACARENAALNGVPGVRIVCSDGFRSLEETGFDLILCNPPYQSDFAVARHFIEKGFNRLKLGGRMYMVTKRRDWYRNKLAAIFGGVRVRETDGYFVFEAEKRQTEYARAGKAGRLRKPGSHESVATEAGRPPRKE